MLTPVQGVGKLEKADMEGDRGDSPFDVKAKVAETGHNAAGDNEKHRRCDGRRRRLLGLHRLREYMWYVSTYGLLHDHNMT